MHTSLTPILNKATQAWQSPGSLQLSSLPPLSLYLHLPWCLRKCPYCDFNSHALKNQGKGLDTATQERYCDALIADLQSALPWVWGRSVHTIFLGGGTPSLFEPALLDRLLGQIRALLPVSPQAEITLEANPGTFEKDRFQGLAQAGITRLSIGVQSLSDSKLQALGRVHNAEQARQAIAEAAHCFPTFNLDLMYALPRQSLAEFEQDLASILALSPPHLSIYHLSLEPNTWFAKHPPPLPDEDSAWDMLDAICAQTASAGLTRYEVSAFSQAGQACQHNLNYWQFGDYLGIGAGAHSKISFAQRIVRQTRFREPATYMQHALNADCVSSSQAVTRRDLPFEYMLGALRLSQGFSLADYCERTGLAPNSIAAPLELAQTKGLIERTHNHIRPTIHGMNFLSDLQSLFLPETT